MKCCPPLAELRHSHGFPSRRTVVACGRNASKERLDILSPDQVIELAAARSEADVECPDQWGPSEAVAPSERLPLGCVPVAPVQDHESLTDRRDVTCDGTDLGCSEMHGSVGRGVVLSQDGSARSQPPVLDQHVGARRRELKARGRGFDPSSPAARERSRGERHWKGGAASSRYEVLSCLGSKIRTQWFYVDKKSVAYLRNQLERDYVVDHKPGETRPHRSTGSVSHSRPWP